MVEESKGRGIERSRNRGIEGRGYGLDGSCFFAFCFSFITFFCNFAAGIGYVQYSMIKQITVLPFSQAAKPGRSEELDFLKGVLILLVISFHLVYFEQLHPYAKQVVYTFHMPGFLLISGYLMNVSKSVRAFLRTLLWLAVPYIVMESGYIVMCSVLPTGEHIDALTPTVFLDHLLLHPLGPYWYLHILILCGGLYYLAFNTPFNTGHRASNTTLRLCIRLLLMGIICKQFVPYLQFDPSGLVFLLVSLASCIAGSLLIAWLMDITGISPYFFGRRGIRK